MNRIASFLLAAVLSTATAPSAQAVGVPDDLAYEASEPAYAALEKQSAAFVAKLRAAPDDTERSVAAESFLSYLAGVESKLSAAGKAGYASEVRAYREKVLLYREDLRAEAEDPFAGDGGDPFAGSSADPFAAPAAKPGSPKKRPAYDPNDPFAEPPPEQTPKPAAPKRPAYDPNDPFATPPQEAAKPAAPQPAPKPQPAPLPAVAGGDPPEPPNPYATDPLDELPPARPATQAQATQQRQPAQPPAAPAGGWLSDPYVVEIDSTLPGVGIGPFEDGDLLVLRYKSGEWTSEENRRFPVKPDVPRVDARERLVLVEGEETTEVPGHTDAAPFVYTLESGGEARLRIGEDPGQDLEHLVDNAGTVTYLAYVIAAEDAEAFRASSEGRRCQFAKTASEKRAEEKADAARRGDPYTLETTKKDDDWDFDFTQNDGKFTIRTDGTEFVMRWMRGPSEEVVFAGADFVRQIGGKRGFKRLPNTTRAFDDLVFAPGSRTVHKGEVIVFRNGEGRMLGVRVDGIRLPNPRTGFPGKLSIHWRVY